MVYYQLFYELPDEEFIRKLCKFYGIIDFNTNYNFTLNDLKKNNIIENLYEIDKELRKYYLECKYDKYIINLTEKKSITILRQFLRIMDYKVVSREKYSNGKKYLIYNLKKVNINPNDYNLTINFE